MKAEGKVIWITGASSGIGAAVAREFRKRGAKLVLSARRIDRLQALVQELGGETVARAIACDVTREGECDRTVEAALQAFGRIDGVMANAGFGVAGVFDDLSLADYQRQIETNVYGVLRTSKAAARELEKTKGFLAITGSVASYLTHPGGSAYAMSKYAVRAFAEALRAEWSVKGVSVTLLSPGFVESEIRRVDNQAQFQESVRDPLPKWLVMSGPDAACDIVNAVLSRKAERIVTGHGKVLVWLSHFARPLIRYVQRKIVPPPGSKGLHRASSQQ